MRAWTAGIVSLVLLAAAGPAGGREPAAEPPFGLTNVAEIHLRLEPAEWARLQPPENTDWNVLRAFEQVGRDEAAGRNFHSEQSHRPGLAGYLGVDHQAGRAEVIFDGETRRDVGVRYKGNGSFLDGRPTGKFSFKLDFGEFDGGREFRGLARLNLQNNITDPSLLREALSYKLFREAGIPSPRVGWARVRLTVPGRFAATNLGLYSLVEQPDKRFLKNRFGSAKGLLLKPSTFGVFRYLGEDWEAYEKAYVPKTPATSSQRQRVIAFARLLHRSGDADFARQIADYLDVDEFLRFLAVNVLLCNLDSFLGGSQNYYVYLDPRSDRFQFLPWDLDHSFGAFDLVGSPETRRDLSVDRPQWGENRLIERVLAIPRYRQAYHERLADFLGTIFGGEKLNRQITEAADFLRPLVPANGPEAAARFERLVADPSPAADPQALKVFVAERRQSVRRQLAGRSTGEVLHMRRVPSFKVLVALALGAVLGLLLNLVACLWGVVAGFRGGLGWGLLNLLLYPVALLVYGFRGRRDLGRRPALLALVGLVILLLAVAGAAWAFH